MHAFSILTRSLSRFLRKKGQQPKFHYEKIAHRLRYERTPWQDVLLVGDFRATDRVLDMGCAEGHVSLQVAKQVAHIDGIEINPIRVEEARRIAKENKANNVSFATGSVTNYPLDPLSYDVTLLLHVIGKKTEMGHVGLAELERILLATRRQIIIRLDVESRANVLRSTTLAALLKKMNELDFDGICFARHRPFYGHVIVGNRRGAEARLNKVPPFVLTPTEQMLDHPCLRGVEIGTYRDFT